MSLFIRSIPNPLPPHEWGMCWKCAQTLHKSPYTTLCPECLKKRDNAFRLRVWENQASWEYRFRSRMRDFWDPQRYNLANGMYSNSFFPERINWILVVMFFLGLPGLPFALLYWMLVRFEGSNLGSGLKVKYSFQDFIVIMMSCTLIGGFFLLMGWIALNAP